MQVIQCKDFKSNNWSQHKLSSEESLSPIFKIFHFPMMKTRPDSQTEHEIGSHSLVHVKVEFDLPPFFEMK